MHYYEIELKQGLNTDQKTFIDAIAQLGGKTIQTSRGLFSAIDSTKEQFTEALAKSAGESALKTLQIVEISAGSPTKKLTPDMQKLMEENP